MQPVQGIHHITAFASDPQANVDFYRRVLGQRLVKTTVNFDDPGTYHFYYGDYTGSPGTLLTFFPWPGAQRGRRGSGEIGAVAYAIAPESVDFWRQRLARHGVAVNAAAPRFGETVLTFEDPDGLPVELITRSAPPPVQVWAEGPIPAEYALRGFHSVTLWVAHAAPTAALLTDILGFEAAERAGNRQRFNSSSGAVGMTVDIAERGDLPRGMLGAGSVHHMAYRARTDDEQAEFRQQIAAAGHGVTPVRDRQYFHSIYFREPGGVLFEIATDPPGFLIDEPVAQLGTSLKLPPWLEPQRELIEQTLPAITLTPVTGTVSDV